MVDRYKYEQGIASDDDGQQRVLLTVQWRATSAYETYE